MKIKELHFNNTKTTKTIVLKVVPTVLFATTYTFTFKKVITTTIHKEECGTDAFKLINNL